MTDDTQAVTEGGQEAPQESPTEPKATDNEEVNQQAQTDDESQGGDIDETEGSEAREQSKRAESRQHELAQKVAEKSEEVESLRSQLERVQGYMNQQSQVSQNTESMLPWLNNNNDGETREITPDEYKRDLISAADTVATMRLAQYQQAQNRVNNFERDVNSIEKNYPELNKDSDGFDKGLSKKITGLYQRASEKNPDLRLKDFVDDVMALREKGETEGRSQATRAIAQQEAQAATTPGGNSGTRSTDENVAEMLKKGEITAKEAKARGLLPT